MLVEENKVPVLQEKYVLEMHRTAHEHGSWCCVMYLTRANGVDPKGSHQRRNEYVFNMCKSPGFDLQHGKEKKEGGRERGGGGGKGTGKGEGRGKREETLSG